MNATLYLSKEEVSKKLGISNATLKNWVKQGFLHFEANKGFLIEDIESFHSEISNGNGKLNTRANKKFSKKTFIPSEYISSEKGNNDVIEILSISNELDLQTEETLLYVSLRILELNNLITISDDKIVFNNMNLENDYKDSFSTSKFIKRIYNQFTWLKGDIQNDFLGCVYQSLKNEGDKSAGGSYYTPEVLVDDIVKDTVSVTSKVLDPCCGTGQFLIRASKIVKSPDNLWGYDIDKNAVSIAKVNLHLQYPNKDFKANIFIKNTLLEDSNKSLFMSCSEGFFDTVITNPPWGAAFSKEEKVCYKKIYPELLTSESFSYFILKGLYLLKDGGKLSYILPESFLWVRKHSQIREYLLRNTRIKAIYHLGRIFKGVFSPVIRIDLVKESCCDSKNIISSWYGLNKYSTTQKILLDDKDFRFNVFLSRDERNIFSKIYKKKHLTLEKNALWALGIVTGNNKKHLKQKMQKGYEPIFKGSEVENYTLGKNKNYIKFEPDFFQQVASEKLYRCDEKLIYRFISKKLVFAYDEKGFLTLNSANILIPQLPNYPIKTILALFNSKVYQLLFQKKFNTIKVLRGDIEQLPLPSLSKSQHTFLVKKVDELLYTQDITTRTDIIDIIDNYIMDIFNFSESEMDCINKFK